jgi:hypothetical protein
VNPERAQRGNTRASHAHIPARQFARKFPYGPAVQFEPAFQAAKTLTDGVTNSAITRR